MVRSNIDNGLDDGRDTVRIGKKILNSRRPDMPLEASLAVIVSGDGMLAPVTELKVNENATMELSLAVKT